MYKKSLMIAALEQARNAALIDEVPVGCIIACTRAWIFAPLLRWCITLKNSFQNMSQENIKKNKRAPTYTKSDKKRFQENTQIIQKPARSDLWRGQFSTNFGWPKKWPKSSHKHLRRSIVSGPWALWGAGGNNKHQHAAYLIRSGAKGPGDFFAEKF